jgi:excisionase family DNA binding protein
MRTNNRIDSLTRRINEIPVGVQLAPPPASVTDPAPVLWAMAQTARALQGGERTVARWIAEAKLLAIRLGKSVRIDPQDVRALIAKAKN